MIIKQSLIHQNKHLLILFTIKNDFELKKR